MSIVLYVIDDFIQDEGLLVDIRNSEDFFPQSMPGENIGEVLNGYHDDESGHRAPFMFWDGWAHEKPRTVRQRVIQEIWKESRFLPFPDSEIAGFEYWTRTFGPGQYLAPHVDEDTFSYENGRKFNAPAVGCVWYGLNDDPGDGFLELHPGEIVGFPEDALEKPSIQARLGSVEQRERIAYKPNRLVVFNAGRRLHETTKTTSGRRQVMVINVWHVDNPPAGLLGERFVRE
jgi:hypothetical protein